MGRMLYPVNTIVCRLINHIRNATSATSCEPRLGVKFLCSSPVHMTFVANVEMKNETIQSWSCCTKTGASGTTRAKE